MDKKEVLHILEDIHFFKGFSPDQIEVMIGKEPKILEYYISDFVIKQGEINGFFYVLLRGALYVTKEDLPDFVINKLNSGTVFGEMGVLGKKPRYANIIARSDATVLQIDYETLPEEIKHAFRERCIELLINRIEDANRQMLKLLVV